MVGTADSVLISVPISMNTGREDKGRSSGYQLTPGLLLEPAEKSHFNEKKSAQEPIEKPSSYPVYLCVPTVCVVVVVVDGAMETPPCVFCS